MVYIAESGWFWTYAFTRNEVLKLKTVSKASFIIACIIAFVLLRIFGIVIGMFGYIIVGIYYWRRAKGLRKKFSLMDEEELSKSDEVKERIQYSSIKDFKLKPGKKPKLTLRYDGNKAKMKFISIGYDEIDKFLSSKIGKK